MKILFNPQTFHKNIFTTIFLCLTLFNSCFPGRQADFEAKWTALNNSLTFESAALDAKVTTAKLTDQQLTDLKALVELRPIEETLSGNQHGRANLKALIQNIINSNIDKSDSGEIEPVDSYGILEAPDEATFAVDADFGVDPEAGAYATGQELLKLGKLTLIAPEITPEVHEGIQSIYNQATDHKVLIGYSTDGGVTIKYLSVTTQGFLKGGLENPIDASAIFELMIFEDKIGFKAKNAGNLILSIKNIKPDSKWIEKNFKDKPMLKFDSKNFSGKTFTDSQMVVKPSGDGFKIKAVTFQTNATDVGYLKIDETDFFCRAQNPTSKSGSPAKNDLNPYSLSDGTEFYIQPFTEFENNLLKASQYSNIKQKIDAYKSMIQNKYVETGEDLRIFLNEVSQILDLAQTDKRFSDALDTEGDNFTNLINTIEAEYSANFSEANINSSWPNDTKKRFEEVTGQVPKDFTSMLYPDQVANLNARFTKLSKNTIDQFLKDFSIVMALEPIMVGEESYKYKIVQAFAETELPILKKIISELTVKNAFKASTSQYKDNLASWTTMRDDTNGIFLNFQSFLKANCNNFIAELESSLLAPTATNPEAFKTKMTKPEQDLFIKKVKRLIDYRTGITTEESIDHGYTFCNGHKDIDNRPKKCLAVLVEIIKQATVNVMPDRAAELSTLSKIIEEAQEQVFSDIPDFAAKLYFLENRRTSVKSATEVSYFLKNFYQITTDRYKASDDQIKRMVQLIEALGFTGEFKKNDNFEVNIGTTEKPNKKTVSTLIAEIKSLLGLTPTYNDFFSKIQAIAAATTQPTDSDVEFVYDSSRYILEKIRAEATQLNDLVTEVKKIRYNISDTQFELLNSKGKNIQKLIESMVSLASERAKEVVEVSQFTLDLASREADLKGISTSTSADTKETILKALEQLIYNRLDAKNADELKKLKELIDWARNHPQMVATKTVDPLMSLTITSPINNTIYTGQKFLEYLGKLAQSEISFAERIKNIENTANATTFKEQVLVDKINKMTESITTASSDELNNAIATLKTIMFQTHTELQSALQPAKTALEARKSQLGDTGGQDFGQRLKELSSHVFTLAESQIVGFIQELWWLVDHRVMGTDDEVATLKSEISDRIQFDEIFKNIEIPNYPEDKSSENLKSQKFFEKLLNVFQTPITFAQRLTDLQATEVSKDERSKTRYFNKAQSMVTLVSTLAPATPSETKNDDNNLIDSAILELRSKKANQLSSMAAQVDALIKTLTNKLAGPIAETEKTYAEKIIDLESRISGLTSDTLANAFAKDLSDRIAEQTQGTGTDIEKLKKLVQQAQYDPIFNNNTVYTKVWFDTKMENLTTGPILSAIVTHIISYKDQLITKEKTTPTTTDEKETFVQKINRAISMLSSVLPGDSSVTTLTSLKDAIVAAKIRFLSKRAAELDAACTKIDQTIDDLKKRAVGEPHDFKSDLEAAGHLLEVIYAATDETIKTTNRSTFSSTSLPDLVGRIAEALQVEMDTLTEIVSAAKRLDTFKGDLTMLNAALATIKTGPTGLKLKEALQTLEGKSEFTKRELFLAVEIATRVNKNKSLIYAETNGAENLKTIVDYLETIRKFPLKNNKKESDAVAKQAAEISTFLANFAQVADERWETFATNLATIENLQLKSVQDLNLFVETLSTMVTNKTYGTQTQINDLLAFLTGPNVTSSDVYLTNGEDVAQKFDPIIAELQKPISFKLRAENLLALISNDEKEEYETLVADRLKYLVEIRGQAFKEGYKLDRLINAISRLKKHVTDNPVSTTGVTEDTRPLAKKLLEDYEKKLNETVVQIGRKSQTAEERITAEETLLKSSKNKKEVTQFFAELDAIISERAGFTPESLKTISKNLIQVAKTRKEWRTVSGMTADEVSAYKGKLDKYELEIAKPITDQDRLRWLNIKIYGESNPDATKTVTEEPLSNEEQELFIKLAKDSVAGAKIASDITIKNFIDALWDAYSYPHKIGESVDLEKIVSAFEGAKEKKSNRQFSDDLEILETKVSSLSKDNVAEFLKDIEELINRKAEALPNEKTRLTNLLTTAKNQRAVQQVYGGTKKIADLSEILTTPVTPVELFTFICEQIGVSPKTGKPGPTDTPNPGLRDPDDATRNLIQNLIVTKIGELISMREQVYDMDQLQTWKEALGFAMSNELSGKKTDIQVHANTLDAYIELFQTKVFKTIPQRIADLTTELGTISQVATNDALAKIQVFVDALDTNLVAFRADALVNEKTNETQSLIDFLNKKVRTHSLVFKDPILKGKIDNLVTKKLMVPSTFAELAARLEAIAVENTSFSDDVKKTFIIVLTKAVDSRNGADTATSDRVKNEVVVFALDKRFNSTSDKSMIDTINTLAAKLGTPMQLPFADLMKNLDYAGALAKLIADYPLTPQVYTGEQWFDNIVALSNTTAITKMLEGKTKAEKTKILEDFADLVTKVADNILKKSTAANDKAMGATLSKNVFSRVIMPEINKLG